MTVVAARHLSKRILQKARRLVFPAPPPPAQLEMVTPEELLLDRPRVDLPTAFILRTYQARDEEEYFQLLQRAGMVRCPLHYWLKHVLSDGFVVIEDKSTGRLVASCFASHQPTDNHPFGGNLQNDDLGRIRARGVPDVRSIEQLVPYTANVLDNRNALMQEGKLLVDAWDLRNAPSISLLLEAIVSLSESASCS